MDIKKLIKKTINSACVYFTLITAVYMLCMTFVTTGDNSPAVEANRVLLFFVFSLLWAAADAVRSIKQIPAPLGRVIHFVVALFGFYACFTLPVRMLPSATLTGLVIFSVLYWLFFGLKAFFTSRLKRNREQSAKYQGQFKNKK